VLRDHPGALHLSRLGLLQGARATLLTAWVGSLWTVGYVAAPALFASLPDRALAGHLAGILFGLEYWIALVSAPLYIACELALGWRGARLALPVAMLAVAAVIEFGLRPRIAAATPGSHSFAWLHGSAALLYLCASVLGLALLWLRPRRQQ
jgi:Domain of unknown function (DUF4149)